MKRRDFLKKSTLTTAALGAAGLTTAQAVDEKDLRKLKGILDAITGEGDKKPEDKLSRRSVKPMPAPGMVRACCV